MSIGQSAGMNDRSQTVERVQLVEGDHQWEWIFLNGRSVGRITPSRLCPGTYEVQVWRDHQTIALMETYLTKALAQSAAIEAALSLLDGAP